MGTMKLRPPTMTDISHLKEMRNDVFLQIKAMSIARGQTEKEIRAWINRYRTATNEILLIIDQNPLNPCVGYIQLNKIDEQKKTSYFAIIIRRENQGAGLGRIALENLFIYVKDKLNLDKLCLEVLSNNTRAIKLYESLGFNRVTTQFSKKFDFNGVMTDIYQMEKTF